MTLIQIGILILGLCVFGMFFIILGDSKIIKKQCEIIEELKSSIARYKDEYIHKWSECVAFQNINKELMERNNALNDAVTRLDEEKEDLKRRNVALNGVQKVHKTRRPKEPKPWTDKGT